jgi:diguanylate cyclase (GGDEF)-like protein
VTWTEVLQRRVDEATDDAARLSALLDLSAWLADADPRAAQASVQEALTAADRLGDPAMMARARCVYGHTLLFAVNPRTAREVLLAAKQQYLTLGQVTGAAWCDLFAGIALEYLGDPGGATVDTERALAVFRSVGDQAGEARALNTLGIGQGIIGRFDEALALLERSGELAVTVRDRVTIGLAWLNAAEMRGKLGMQAAEDGHEVVARDYFTAALAELEAVQRHAVRTGFVGLEPCALAYQVVPLTRLGRLDDAVELGELAIVRAGALELDDAAAQSLHYAGQARLARGNLVEAAAHLERALALYEQWELTHETVPVLELLVETHERLGDLAAAFALHKRLLVATLRLRDDVVERKDQVAAARYEAERELKASERGRRQLQQLARANRRLADERRAMERLAHTDALTGLANRRHFDAQLGRVLVHAELTGEEVSLVLIDIDHFKWVNDRHSHLVGDAVLRALSTEITRHCRVSDLAARIGGEEFVVLLPNTGRTEALAVAERLRASVEALDLTQFANGVRITVSAGVAGTSRAMTAEALLAAADEALYAAKRGGRNQVRGATA